MVMDKIIVKGAREHNLKNINVEMPREKFIVITGLSGSGKSTLAFDTIYAEGQRRYVESLSSYARQFLGLMNKPDLDSIEGLSPAISIEQKTTSKNPRSTVGTVTEIYDYLRLLFARVGTSYCPKCAEPIKPQSTENIVNLVLSEQGKRKLILAPIIRGAKGTYEKLFEDLKKEGFNRVRVDGIVYELETILEDIEKLERYEKHWIEIVIDRVKVDNQDRQRISDSVEQALKFGKGTVVILDHIVNEELLKKFGTKIKEKQLKEIQREAEIIYSTFGACSNHPEVVFEELEPRMFSFNSPFGACSNCLGLGQKMTLNPELMLPDKNLSIMDGAVALYGRLDLKFRGQQIAAVGKQHGFDVFTPIKDIKPKALKILIYGDPTPIRAIWSNGANMDLSDGWEGLIGQTLRLYKQSDSDSRKKFYEKFMETTHCETCDGKRLKDVVLGVKIAGKSIIDTTELSIEDALNFFKTVEDKLTDKEKFIANQVLKEIVDRLTFLNNVGLGYLSLSRSAGTLSGGEAQRIRLATQIGSNLMGVLYILDEPSIGLHQRDNSKLIDTLHRLRDVGNTLIVVEHDEDTMKAADYLIDIGPGAGVHGGNIVAAGTPQEVMDNPKSLTGQYLSGKIKIERPKKLREHGETIEINGATANNLKNVDIKIPTKIMCGVTGVSGSGKSSLINQTLVPALQKNFKQIHKRIGAHKKIGIPSYLDNIIVINQDPIGRTPRSNPATYIKVFDDIRKIFAQTKMSKERGYKEGRFSFNVHAGRCETCSGDGEIKIEMNFLPDVYVKCDECHGKRYNKDTLEVLYKNKNIAEILDMSVEDAAPFFENHPSIYRKINTLQEVGLGYIRLGQPSTQLSGGESQRIKLTKELAKFKKGNTLYVLDEPTTGLHFEDVKKLLNVMNRLVDKGNSIIVIEHNLDVIKCCDYVIDIGPEGGSKGGEIVAVGTPEEICKNKKSYTGKFLKSLL
jgi:excinuclease ABC subunit A